MINITESNAKFVFACVNGTLDMLRNTRAVTFVMRFYVAC